MTRLRLTRIGFAIAAAAIIITATVVASQPADAARPGPQPLCGFTAIWTCTLPNGNEVEKIGTVCDIRKFERRTGATCEL